MSAVAYKINILYKKIFKNPTYFIQNRFSSCRKLFKEKRGLVHKVLGLLQRKLHTLKVTWPFIKSSLKKVSPPEAKNLVVCFRPQSKTSRESTYSENRSSSSKQSYERKEKTRQRSKRFLSSSGSRSLHIEKSSIIKEQRGTKLALL